MKTVLSSTKKNKISGTVLYGTVLSPKREDKSCIPNKFSVNAPIFEEVCFRNYHARRRNKFFFHEEQGIKKICRLS